MKRRQSSKEFVLFPICHVMDDVIGDPVVFVCITDDMVVKTRLPGKGQLQSVGVFGDGRFVRTDY